MTPRRIRSPLLQSFGAGIETLADYFITVEQEQGEEGQASRRYDEGEQIFGRENCRGCMDLLSMGSPGH
jgi:hypothetical protein